MGSRDSERRQQRRRPEQPKKPDLKQLLLAPEARTDALTPTRAPYRRRNPVVIE
ncbi:MAG: hypothetical protein OXG33_11975 [Chloroflexi bacterium]|nr:hypothetical protein [Chloroflexota bacterium]